MREDLKNKLFESAIAKAKNLGYTLTSVANDDIKKFIGQGIDKMSSSEYFSTVENKRAERNLMTLIEKMAEGAKKRRLYESLDYKSFSEARSSICPLWPFC